MFVSISHCQLGDTVLIRKSKGNIVVSDIIRDIVLDEDEVEVDIIGKFYSDEMCIGWHSNEALGLRGISGNPVKNAADKWKSDTRRYTMASNASDYMFYEWVSRDTLVKLKKEIVVSPNRKCIGCNLPAPHGDPNLPENKFQCLSCKVLKDLE
jgi:hypothetical protein